MSDDNTRPISVAELLARNGTIGSPPVSGHRRRKRRNAVSVSDLTGEIPVIRTGENPVVVDEESADEPPTAEQTGAVSADSESEDQEHTDTMEDTVAAGDEAEDIDVTADAGAGVSTESVENADAADESADVVEVPEIIAGDDVVDVYEADEASDVVDASETVEVFDTVEGEDIGESADVVEVTDVVEASDIVEAPETVEAPENVEAPETVEVADDLEAAAVAQDTDVAPDSPIAQDVEIDDDEIVQYAEEPSAPEGAASQPVIEARPRSRFPLPRRRRGPQRSHDPRPQRRSSGAEQMSYDPIDEAVDLSELDVEEAPEAEELRSYLHSSTGTLFSGETVADDLARRGLLSETDEGSADQDREPASVSTAAPRRGVLRTVGSSVIAILQSLFAVVFGAGLFIAFDQLWRWNNVVALALSTLVIVALVVGVHVVRKTEDFVSILIAVAVGILVTFGPLALQST